MSAIPPRCSMPRPTRCRPWAWLRTAVQVRPSKMRHACPPRFGPPGGPPACHDGGGRSCRPPSALWPPSPPSSRRPGRIPPRSRGLRSRAPPGHRQVPRRRTAARGGAPRGRTPCSRPTAAARQTGCRRRAQTAGPACWPHRAAAWRSRPRRWPVPFHVLPGRVLPRLPPPCRSPPAGPHRPARGRRPREAGIAPRGWRRCRWPPRPAPPPSPPRPPRRPPAGVGGPRGRASRSAPAPRPQSAAPGDTGPDRPPVPRRWNSEECDPFPGTSTRSCRGRRGKSGRRSRGPSAPPP